MVIEKLELLPMDKYIEVLCKQKPVSVEAKSCSYAGVRLQHTHACGVVKGARM